MMHHHLTPLWTAVFTAAAVVTFTPWGRLRAIWRQREELRDAVRGLVRSYRRSPGPAHPSARALQQPQRVTLSDEECDRLWRELEQPRGTPDPRDGSER
jgi:hypothetical protein